MPASDSAPVPAFLYGSAWKEGRTQTLTELALRSGFRGIDTANQRRVTLAWLGVNKKDHGGPWQQPTAGVFCRIIGRETAK